MSNNETKNNRIKEIVNLIICFLAHGSKLPADAEYKEAMPMRDNKIIMNIKKTLIFIILEKFIKFFVYKYSQMFS
jgi:hypothetical protein